MHPYRVINRTYRLSVGLFTIPDGPNTLTCRFLVGSLVGSYRGFKYGKLDVTLAGN